MDRPISGYQFWVFLQILECFPAECLHCERRQRGTRMFNDRESIADSLLFLAQQGAGRSRSIPPFRTGFWVTLWVKLGNLLGYNPAVAANTRSVTEEAADFIKAAREAGRMSQGPFTARDIIALEAMKARATGMGGRVQEVSSDEMMDWCFEIADAFVARSTSRWAAQERSGNGGHNPK